MLLRYRKLLIFRLLSNEINIFVCFIYIYNFIILYEFYEIDVTNVELSILSIVNFNLLFIKVTYEKIVKRVVIFLQNSRYNSVIMLYFPN